MAAAETTTDLSLTPFERHVKQALRLYDQPDRLGRESPLASPYVLGRALRDAPRPVTERARGEVLCAEIRAAAVRLWRGALPASRDELLEAIIDVRRDPDDSRYAYVVLELRCFHTYVTPYRTSDIWEQPHLLPGSKSQHYRDFDAAVKRLAAVLLDTLRPAQRQERPRLPEAIYGYDRQIEQVAEALAQGGTVALSGPGGAGKTSVGAAAVERLAGRPAFWYTLRPGFNDGVHSLLFALGAFLRELGALNLWQYLVTSNGAITDLNLAAGLLRQDLAGFEQAPAILCFDDLEHLYADGSTWLSPARAQLSGLIEGLRGTTPMLLISQRPLPVGDMHLDLAGLGPADVEQLWRAAGRDLSIHAAERLCAYTAGNPRLLTLILTLRDDSDGAALELEGASAARSLLPAFQQLWRRLLPDERRALQRLAVYQSYAPEDVLAPATLESLARLRLVERDGAGGAALLPAIAPIVHGELSPELREALHGEAGAAHLERGEYTAAAYHFVQGNQEQRAVQVWFPQRRHAIARGEADAARPIFSAISRQRLGPPERKALDLIRAELRQLAGQHQEGLDELEQIDWPEESEASARLWMLRGELEDALGYPDRALESYAEGLRVTARLIGQLAALRQRRGFLFQHRRDLHASWREIHRAEFDLEVLRGLLREEEGAYDAALEAFGRAHALADQLDDDALRAQAGRQLAAVCGRREQLAEAVAYAGQALAIYERLGDRVNLEKLRSNLSAIYVQTRQFPAALEVGAPAYAFFWSTGDPYFAAVTGANLAEASYELGDLDAAARYAGEVLELGDRFAAPYARFTLGQIDLARSDPSAAIANFSDSMQRAGQNDDPYMLAYAQRALGQAYLAAAQPEAGEQHIHAALALFRQLDIPGEIAATEQLISEMQLP